MQLLQEIVIQGLLAVELHESAVGVDKQRAGAGGLVADQERIGEGGLGGLAGFVAQALDVGPWQSGWPVGIEPGQPVLRPGTDAVPLQLLDQFGTPAGAHDLGKKRSA